MLASRYFSRLIPIAYDQSFPWTNSFRSEFVVLLILDLRIEAMVKRELHAAGFIQPLV